ncbi:hypothetical protein BCR44DRAFT_36345 [Catenaria anguillulae PL171]|uniref:FHA domain-containing protein n=1 Tax=Catenaria anguillulae PL171 TaxID=765915 RepID=A0A1Y2HSW0_9FUNG|nr:hypothetical protein BCR44DRAFT_36345 [Catenaria anguillulae PL171]
MSSFAPPSTAASGSSSSSGSSSAAAAAAAAPPPAPAPKLPYTEPEWAAPPRPNANWSLEVLKSGVILDRLAFPTHSSLLTIGRLPRPHCSIELEHPSISRFHAVLQLSRDGQLFLYDLGSTHGTFVNKVQVPAKTHTRVWVGDMLRFGSSSRMFIVHGPPDQERLIEDHEPASALSDHGDPIDQNQEQHASWGIIDRASSPSSSYTARHHLDQEPDQAQVDLPIPPSAPWAKDPRKSLADWLDARGLPLDFEYANDSTLLSGDDHSSSRKHSNHQLIFARIQVPLDADDPTLANTQLVGQGSATRKRDAERLAMLQVLAQLDAMGLLATRAGESAASARVRKLLSDADRTSDGEDEFFDRSGASRHPGANHTHANKKAVVETFESLNAKMAELQAKREGVQLELDEMRAQLGAGSAGDAEVDELDAYMQGLDQAQMREAVKVKEQELGEVDKDLERVKQLVEIARPSSGSSVAAALSPIAVPKLSAAAPKSPAKKRAITDDEQSSKPPSPKRTRTVQPDLTAKPASVVAQRGPARPPAAVAPRSLARDMGMDVEAEVESDDEEQMTRQEKSVEWMPPQGQTGDGRTALNDKLGY